MQVHCYGVGVEPISGYGCISSLFKEIVITMSWISWLHISVGAFDSDGLMVMVMVKMVWWF